jgi:O-antigen ligase
MSDELIAVPAVAPAEGRGATAVLSLSTIWFASLLAAILSGSSSLTLQIAGKNAAVYWVDLWVALAYPSYLLVVRGGKLPRVRRLWLLVFCSLGWELLGVLGAVDRLRGARLLALHGVGLVVYWFAAFVQLSRREAVLLTRLLLLAPLVMLVLSLASFASIGSSQGLATAATERVIESAVGRSNALATLFGAFGVFGLGLWATTSRFRVLATLGIAAAGLGLSLTGSRAGMLATVAGFGAYLLQTGGKGRRTQALVAAGIVVLLIVALHALGATTALEDRFQRLERPKSIGEGPIRNVLIRLDYWRVSLLMLRESPLVGQGLGSFESHYVQRGTFTIDRPTDPHNQIFLLLGETGLVGTFLALGLAFSLLRRAWPPKGQGQGQGRILRQVLLAGLAVAFLHSLAEPVFRNPSSVALVALLLGLASNPSYFLQFERAAAVAGDPDAAAGSGGEPQPSAPRPDAQ